MTYDQKAEADRMLDTVVQSVEVDFYDERYEVDARACRKSIEQALTAAYEAGRAAATPPPGHVLTDDGVVRRVLGTLPVTADGCVATINGTFYTPLDDHPAGICGMAAWAEGNAPVGKRLGFPVSYVGADRTWNSNECYSTREAADAAAEAARQRGEA